MFWRALTFVALPIYLVGGVFAGLFAGATTWWHDVTKEEVQP